MQGLIVTWLKKMKEDVAANWFETYWTGEHGNYTNATAGYVGNNKSAGIESHGSTCAVIQWELLDRASAPA